MSARGRRPNQAGIAALARSTAPRAASSIARRERNVKAAAVRNRPSSAPTSRVRNERRAEQAVELGEADADVAPGRAEPEAEARSLILLFAGKVRGNRTPPRQGLPPRHLRPHRLQ